MNEGHPVQALWCDPADGVVARIVRALAERQLHAARTVVLVPYAQLMGVARAMWARCGSPGFVPRFETTYNWARSAGGFVPTGYDIAHDMARDLVTAQALLSQAGFNAERFALAGRVVELAYQLAPLAAAVTPEERGGEWAQRAAGVAEAGSESEWFRIESALIRIAVAWTSTSGYATDVLQRDSTRAQVDALIVLEGFQTDPLTQSLCKLWGDHALHLSLVPSGVLAQPCALHIALDPEDEAELAAACVLRHLAEDRAPVALVATDRALTRRISAQLSAQGVVTHDETGWKLSTTRAAATLMSALRACAHDAASDQVLEWLKSGADGDAPTVQLLEARLRREGQRDWSAWCAFMARSEKPQDATLLSFTEAIEERRAPMTRSRPLAEWLHALRELLEASGQWALLDEDLAGGKVIGALWLDAGAHGDDDEFPGGRHTLAEFTAWVRDVLEDASFVPPAGDQAPKVVVLPLYQLLGRAFGAVVIPGCDDRRLPASPEPPGNWSAAQRLELGLPSRETLEAAQRAAWAAALHNPSCELIWRQSDASGEPVRPSPLVQALQLDHALQPSVDPRTPREVVVQPTKYPTPSGALLPLENISTSVYEDLRRCPYRFFALRQLGLRSADELDAEIDKRDFGNWLHAVLGHFHEALAATPTQDAQERTALIEEAARRSMHELSLSEAEFLPFAAAWPAVRDGYLGWLTGHEAAGAVFAEAEPWKEQPLGNLRLIGRLDRIDRMPDGQAFVIDYKTESAAVSKERVKDPTEDTQLAFYAALVADDTLRAAYVNVGEKSSGTQTVEQPAVVEARDALVAGIIHDFTRIAQGAALPPLGEGAVCDYCAARGLCRKDFWEASK
ncbi:ATP-dependent helicase/nuclease subunit B [Variovorax boronicumulans]|uniref:PD-(D/E)XK nuclease family protein n=1 Tax=Variovorax boronicumulans TaxID=436515 RepID=UPI0027843999|nr:PD-(D/E)XK nuclease family protein [Variovorax boronicumulans]MDQ0080310.1 ATP-dependent helicase/nuclease subunit B [Variovorax boronicumulans]